MERRKRTKRTHSCPLPDDFPQRLKRLKDASGLGWKVLARSLGVGYLRVHRWRRGMEPSGGALLAIFLFASEFPGGVDVMPHGTAEAPLAEE